MPAPDVAAGRSIFGQPPAIRGRGLAAAVSATYIRTPAPAQAGSRAAARSAAVMRPNEPSATSRITGAGIRCRSRTDWPHAQPPRWRRLFVLARPRSDRIIPVLTACNSVHASNLSSLSLSLSGHCTSIPQISLSDPSRAQGEAEGKRGGKGRERALHACTHVSSPRRRDCAPPWALERTPPKCRFACLDVVSCVPADSQHSLSPTTPSPPCIRRICRHPGCGLGAPQRACPKRRPRGGGFRSRAHIGMGLHRSAAISRRRCVAVLECVCRCAPAMSAHLLSSGQV